MSYLERIEDAITAAVKEQLDAEFQRGVERGRLERRSEELKMEELRRRERSIGAEQELRRFVGHYPEGALGCNPDLMLDRIKRRADQIRDAREKGGAE
jgi:hypothetical protein